MAAKGGDARLFVVRDKRTGRYSCTGRWDLFVDDVMAARRYLTARGAARFSHRASEVEVVELRLVEGRAMSVDEARAEA